MAGGIGSLGRYALGGLTHRIFGNGFPYGTLAANVAGCFLIGFIVKLGILTDAVPPESRIPLTVGFLGGFTTFSTFSYETVRYLQEGAWNSALLNLSVNIIFCLAATWAGLIISQKLYGGI